MLGITKRIVGHIMRTLPCRGVLYGDMVRQPKAVYYIQRVARLAVEKRRGKRGAPKQKHEEDSSHCFTHLGFLMGFLSHLSSGVPEEYRPHFSHLKNSRFPSSPMLHNCPLHFLMTINFYVKINKI